MKLKTAASRVGHGLLDVASSVAIEMNDGPLNQRITAIDAEIEKLQTERAMHQAKLIKK